MNTTIQKTQGKAMDTAARFLHLQNQRFFDENDQPREGDYLDEDDTIIRYHDGYIHSDDEPAIETADCHMEFWQHGRLHRADFRPAVISDYGETEEYWLSGERVK